jgi:hypothetical protein
MLPLQIASLKIWTATRQPDTREALFDWVAFQVQAAVNMDQNKEQSATAAEVDGIEIGATGQTDRQLPAPKWQKLDSTGVR